MSRIIDPIRLHLLAAALAAIPLSALAVPASAQSSPVDQPAGPLGRALSAFASQRGIALSFEPELTGGLQAPALHGVFSDKDGLERLLAGTGLRLVARADGSYTLDRLPPAGSGVMAFQPLRVGGQRTFPYSEGMVLEQDYIEDTNKGNGDIATLLRINPAVQFSDTARSSRNMGEIRPADFSINGAPYYENLFLLDGVSFNNDIDPTFDNPNHYADVPSQSQGIAVDTDLLESVTVYDSNVPAAYGSFTGGVVEAKTRKADQGFHGKVWYRMARSAWDDVIIPNGQEESYEQSASYSYQPAYDKYKLGARLEGRTRNGLGLIGTILRTRSEIPLRGYTSGSVSSSDSNRKTQTRQNTSATLNLDWSNGEGVELGANLVYAPTDDRYFIQNANNAWFDIKQGGPVLSLRADIRQGAWKLKNTLSYSDLESSRRSQENYWKAWARSDAYDWGVNNSSFEGSWGNVDQHDRKVGYQFIADRDAFDWGPTVHNLQFGASYQRRKANYERLNNHYSYLQPYATTSCLQGDEGCSLSPVLTTSGNLVAGQGQYFRRLTIYQAGEFSVSGDQSAAWLQDDIRLGNLSLRPGVRADDDSIWKKTTIAPRLAVSWDALGDRSTVLSAGLNRYYGRNFFSYLLREGRERLTLVKTRTSSGTAWDDVAGTTATSTNRLADVDIPYTNEWTVGLDQRWGGFLFGLKYVSRDNRDEVLRQSVKSNDATGYYSSSVYQYVNKGRSGSDVLTLTVSPLHPWLLGGSSTQVQFGFDHTDTHRNYTDYQTSWNDSSDELVLYKGEATWLYDLPATDFARKWTLRLSTQTRMPLARGELLWSNFARYRAGFRDIVETGSADYQGQTLPVYGDVNYPRAFTLDTTLEYSLDLAHDQQVYLRLEASNVLNRANKVSGTTESSAYYEIGRSFWLEAGYKF